MPTHYLQIVRERAEIEFILLDEIVERELVLLVLLVAPADSPPRDTH